MKPTPEELATWQEIIAQCQWTGQDYSKQINCGTIKRRYALIAVARYIEWLEGQLNDTLPNPQDTQTPDPRP